MWLSGGKLPTEKLEIIIEIKGMQKDIDYVLTDLITGEKLWTI